MANKYYLDKSGLTYFWSKIKAKLSDKQDTLVSSTNIKTINNTSLLGAGNISIPTNFLPLAGNLPCVRDSYHDRIAFLKIQTNELTTDGTTWTAATDTSTLNNLFIQKQDQTILVLPTTAKARRFTLTGTQYSQTEWFEFFVTYANSGAAQQFIFKIETSGNATDWTTRYETTFSSIMAGAYCHTGVISGGVDTYYRFTFTKTGSVTNREVRLAFLRGFTRRRGNQGLGIEQELPYNWDASKNFYSVGGLYEGSTRVVRSVTVAGSSVRQHLLQLMEQ